MLTSANWLKERDEEDDCRAEWDGGGRERETDLGGVSRDYWPPRMGRFRDEHRGECHKMSGLTNTLLYTSMSAKMVHAASGFFLESVCKKPTVLTKFAMHLPSQCADRAPIL